MDLPRPALPPRRPGRWPRWGRWVIVVWFGALVTVPPLLLAAGVRPAQIEQRRAAPAPGFTIGGLLDADWYRQIAAWFTDRLPGRNQAIEADALIDFHLFGRSPSRRVLVGTDGWLFLRDDLQAPCYSDTRLQAAAGEVALLERVLRLAGKDLLFLVAPDKSAIYRDHLGNLAADTPCPAANRAVFRELLTDAGIGGYVDTWSVLESAAASTPIVYHRLDTHWNDFGAGVVAAEVVDRLAPGLWDPAAFVYMGSHSRVGDLAKIMGLSLAEEAEIWEVHRGEEPSLRTEAVGRTVDAVISTMQRLPIIEGSALMVHDSMGNALAPLLRPYFGSLTTVRALGVRGSLGTERSWFEERLGEADLLVVVSVERIIFPRLQGVLAGDVIGALAEMLPHRDLALTRRMAGSDLGTRWARRTGEIVATGAGEARVPFVVGGAEPGVDRYLVVGVEPRGEAEVRLTWVDAADGRVRELVDVVPAGGSTAVFGLGSAGDATEFELRLGMVRGRRVSRLSVVALPPD